VKATVIELDVCAAMLACQVFTAEEPDGIAPGSTTHSRCVIALLKYGTGLPFNGWSGWRHNSGFHYRSHSMGVDGARRGFLKPILDELIRQAAQAACSQR